MRGVPEGSYTLSGLLSCAFAGRATLSSAPHIAAALLLCGCPSPNTYTVPRTLEPGDLQLNAAAEVYAFSGDVAASSSSGGMVSTSRGTGATPELPTVGIRYGLVDGVDVGARFANLDSLAGDVKIRLLRGTLDLALDPGFQAIDVTATGSDPSQSIGVFYLHAPLLVGLNLSDTVTLVASPGFAYSIETATPNGDGNSVRAGAQTEAWVRFGLGVDIRTSQNFAWHPEVTCLNSLGGSDTLVCIGGLGVIVGPQPTYGDPGEGHPH
jgi:hypothetical protein